MVKFGLLGPLLLHDGTGLRPVSGPKVRALLAVLLLRANRTVSRDALKAALWGDDIPASADAALANHLTRLRRALAATAEEGEARLLTVAPGYQLVVHEGELDADVFEARLRELRRAHRRQDWDAVVRDGVAAQSLWRGTPLADVSPLAEQDEPMLRVHQLVEERLQMLELNFDAELRRGRRETLIGPLTALVAEHPLQEPFHVLLMTALDRSGRRADAINVFHGLRRSLSDELGVPPGADARRAYESLLAGDGPGAAPHHPHLPPPFQVPCDAPSFVGRADEVKRVSDLLTAADGARADGERQVRAVVVAGMAGVGKTALAVHVAHRMRTAFPDGILYADLRGYCAGRPRPPGDLIPRFLSDLGIRHGALPDDLDDRALHLQQALAERRVLLLLDNARDAAHAAPLLPTRGPSVALITSRHLLPDLPGAARVPLTPLPSESQWELLAALCGEKRLLAEPAAMDEILAACGGLPLALTVVGARLTSRPAWPLALLAGRLTPHQGRLETLSMGSVDVERTFAVSHLAMRDSPEPLEREAARAFRLLGLWAAHPVTPRSAAALFDVTAEKAASLLDLLADAHLVHSPAPDRYALHDLLGEYAVRLAAADEPEPEREQAVTRLLAWYATAVAAACRTATGETQSPPPLGDAVPWEVPAFADDTEAIRWSAQELPAVQEAVERAAELGRSDIAWRLAVGLFGYATTHWWTGEWDACLARATEIARAHDDRLGQAWLHRRIAVAHGMAYRSEASLEHLRIALAMFTERGDLRAQASILGNMAAAHGVAGDAEQSLLHARRSHELYTELFRETPDPRAEALSLSRLADARQMLGEYAQAAEGHRRVAELLRASGRGVFLATSLTRLGDCLAALGRREEAFDALAEALGIRQRMDDHSGTADCLLSVAKAHERFGERAEARANWEACLELGRRHRLVTRVEECLAALHRMTEQGH
ncbi:BTAD domain-containing putative transcriptional regulator [Streptomyces sp. NPDC093094]|uniref:AfsR/SARP family transcriptional regulator n=1 Tax=Streptomyces sp. NPDC093094 TaxID=3366026 RepID=UPI0038149CC6